MQAKQSTAASTARAPAAPGSKRKEPSLATSRPMTRRQRVTADDTAGGAPSSSACSAKHSRCDAKGDSSTSGRLSASRSHSMHPLASSVGASCGARSAMI